MQGHPRQPVQGWMCAELQAEQCHCVGVTRGADSLLCTWLESRYYCSYRDHVAVVLAPSNTEVPCCRYTGEEGYTIREACILARSTHPGQQRAACMLLSAVICRASPFQADSFDDGPTVLYSAFWMPALRPKCIRMTISECL